MQRKEQLANAIKNISWGYIMLYFNINLGTIDILPAWWSYLWLFQTGIKEGLSEEEESVRLLKPLSLILGIYNLITWFMTMFGIPSDVFIITEFMSVIALYFHFQLLTNLATIAGKYSCFQEKSLLHLRTIHTILMTVLTFTVHFEEIYWLSLGIIVVQVVIMICICVVLRNFKRAIEELPESAFYEQNIENE